jgi:hypothetical protein
MKTIREAIEANKELSLRKIALGTGISYFSVLKIAKAPRTGEVYDPEFMNYEAVENYMRTKIGSEKFEQLNWEDYKDTTLQPTQKEYDWLKVGVKTTLRNPSYNEKYSKDTIFEVVYLTKSHVVLQPSETTEPRLMLISTYIACGPKEVEAK